MHSLADLGAARLAAAFRSGEASPVDALRAVLERVDAWEPLINAMYLVHATPRSRRRASRARWRAGRPLSALDGCRSR